jgi:hypothetical protein
MTITLSKAQIEALSVELGRYGLVVRPAPKPRAEACEISERIAKLKAMSFKTAGVKSAILRNLSRVKKEGWANEKYGFNELDYPPMGKRWDCVHNAYNWRSGRLLLTYQPT